MASLHSANVCPVRIATASGLLSKNNLGAKFRNKVSQANNIGREVYNKRQQVERKRLEEERKAYGWRQEKESERTAIAAQIIPFLVFVAVAFGMGGITYSIFNSMEGANADTLDEIFGNLISIVFGLASIIATLIVPFWAARKVRESIKDSRN